MSTQWADQGLELNLGDLIYDGRRRSVVDYLESLGWQVSARPRPEVFAGYGRAFPTDPADQTLRHSLSSPQSERPTMTTTHFGARAIPGTWHRAWGHRDGRRSLPRTGHLPGLINDRWAEPWCAPSVSSTSSTSWTASPRSNGWPAEWPFAQFISTHS